MTFSRAKGYIAQHAPLAAEKRIHLGRAVLELDIVKVSPRRKVVGSCAAGDVEMAFALVGIVVRGDGLADRGVGVDDGERGLDGQEQGRPGKVIRLAIRLLNHDIEAAGVATGPR
jgi:hypothetical protein